MAHPEMPWRLRRPRPEDEAALSALVTAAATAAWGDFLGRERIEAATGSERHPVDLVAEDEDGVLGFVAWDEASGEITRLYIHPRAWGRGAGSALLERALEALRATGHNEAWLNTEERGKRARRFYERHGWREDGTVRVRDWHGARLHEPCYVKEL